MKEIEGWPGYFVTEYGSVFSQVKSSRLGNNLRKLKDFDGGKGYRYVNLCINQKRKKIHVARLVCQAFLPNRENRKTVNHKNGDKSDNTLKNLEWMTYQENHVHAFKVLGRVVKPHAGKKGKDNPASKPTIQLSKSGQFIARYESQSLAGDATGIGKKGISKAIKRNGSSGGFLWRRA